MTTIAYRNGIVAADRRMTSEGSILAMEHTKIHRDVFPDSYGLTVVTISASVGDVEANRPWLDWVRRRSADPAMPETDEEGGSIIKFTFDGRTTMLTVYNVSTGRWWNSVVEHGAYIAFGSGSEYAEGAMAYSPDVSAYEAVLAASKHDTATGNVIDTLSFKQGEDQ